MVLHLVLSVKIQLVLHISAVHIMVLSTLEMLTSASVEGITLPTLLTHSLSLHLLKKQQELISKLKTLTLSFLLHTQELLMLTSVVVTSSTTKPMLLKLTFSTSISPNKLENFFSLVNISKCQVTLVTMMLTSYLQITM